MAFTDLFKINDLKNRITILTSENAELTLQVNSLKDSFAQAEYKAKQCEAELQKIKDYIKSYLPLFDIEKINIPDNFEKFQELWISWGVEIHSRTFQIERQNRACNAILTPLKLSPSTASGHFKGHDIDYCTSLIRCECMDFQRRALPCKHMYRLAYELDVFMLDDVEVHPDIKHAPRFKDLKNKLDALSNSNINLLDEIIYSSPIVFEHSDINVLLKREFIQVADEPYILLDSILKEELFKLLPDNHGLKKNIKKSDLISTIISDYPDVIDIVSKIKVAVEPHRNIVHLLPEIATYLRHRE